MLPARAGLEVIPLLPLVPGMPVPSLSAPGIRLGRSCGSFEILGIAENFELELAVSCDSILCTGHVGP